MPASIAAISDKLGIAARRFDIDVLASCASTNAVLLSRAEAGAPSWPCVGQTCHPFIRPRFWMTRFSSRSRRNAVSVSFLTWSAFRMET